MNKQEFLTRLQKGLSGLPSEDREERVNFYSEMIDDRVEEGILEEDAVAEIGDVDTVISQIVADTPLTRLVKEKIKPKRKLRGWEIALLIIGSPMWLSLLCAMLAVGLSLYVSLWAVVVSLWAVFGALVGCAAGGIASCIRFGIDGNVPNMFAFMGASLVCTGLFIFMFFGCKAATKGSAALTKKLIIVIKNCFMKKE